MKARIALGLLVALAAALRLWNLGGPSLWMDEGFTWMVASRPFSDMPGATLFVEKHPPLQYLLVHVMLWFGRSEFWLRLPFALAGVATVLATFKLGEELYGVAVGLAAASLLAVSSLQVLMSRECRDYPLACLFLTLSAWLWWRRSLVWHFVCSLLAIYSHYYCVIGLCLQWLSDREPLRRGWWVPGGLAVLYLPWVPTMLRQARTPSPGHVAPDWRGLVEVLFSQMAGFSLNFSDLHYYYAVALLAAVMLAMVWRAEVRPAAYLSALFLGLVGITWLGSAVSGAGLFEAKYMVLVNPFFWLLFCAAALRLPRLAAGAVLMFALCINLVSTCNLLFFDEWRHQDWRSVAVLLRSHLAAGDQVVVEPHYIQPVLQYYLGDAVPQNVFRFLTSSDVERASASDFQQFRRVWLVRSASLSSDPVNKVGALLAGLSQREWAWRTPYRRNPAFDVYVTVYWMRAPGDKAGASTTTVN